jgi:hypothetical protein
MNEPEQQSGTWLQPDPEAAFQPGEKIVCINDQFTPEAKMQFSSLPKRGQVYVVRECRGDWVLLVGIMQLPTRTLVHGEDGFSSKLFLSLPDYRQMRANAQRILEEFQELNAYWKIVDSCDANGNPRIKKTRKPKGGSI